MDGRTKPLIELFFETKKVLDQPTDRQKDQVTYSHVYATKKRLGVYTVLFLICSQAVGDRWVGQSGCKY